MSGIIEEGCYALAYPNSGVSVLNLNNEINLFGSYTSIKTTDVVSYSTILDEPTQLKKDNGWIKNLALGIIVTAALAVAAVVTGGGALAVVALAGAAVGAAAVTAGATYSDIKSGKSRSLGEFASQLALGTAIGFTTGVGIYSLATAIPAAAAATGLQASMFTGSVSTFTAVTIPKIATVGGYAVVGAVGVLNTNEIFAIGSGTNVLVETVFDGDIQAYEETMLLVDLLAMGIGQVGADNAALLQYNDDVAETPQNPTRGKGSGTSTQSDTPEVNKTPQSDVEAPPVKSGGNKKGVYVESESGSTTIHNDILDSPRTGSALKVDDVKPIYKINEKTGKPQIIKEFPATAQSHGFNDIVDNYAGYATKTPLNNATLYQLDGSLNGVAGRFEWIIQDGNVTHRMFIQNGTMNGVPIKP